MEIFINTQGTATKLSPQHVYQGTNVSQINLYAPFPSQTSLSVAFMLPDGTTTPYYPMTFTGVTSSEAEGINLWQYVMPFAITQDAGAARVAFLATFNENGTAAQQTSAYVDFTIEQSALPVLPDEPTPDVWTQILSYLSAQDTKIAAIQSDVADIEQVADEANTNADAALTTANKANTTATQAKTTADGIDGKATQALATSQTAEQAAQEAKTTADGLADSIAQANETASQANATAEEAKEIAEGAAQGNGTRVSVGGAFQQTLSFTSDPQTQITQNASAVAATEQSIADIENGTTTVAKANEATKASQDANGNVISDTYAKQTGRYPNLKSGGNTVVDTRAVNSPPSYYGGQTTYCEFKTTATLGLADYMPNAEYVLLTTKKGWISDYIAYQEAVSAGYSQNDIRDSIKCYRYGAGETWGEWKVIFAVDPTKLKPSTANGWTQTAANGNLPGEGVYMVIPNASVGALGIGVMFYAANRTSTSVIGGLDSAFSLSYMPSGDTKWVLYNVNGTQIQLIGVYYKRIA